MIKSRHFVLLLFPVCFSAAHAKAPSLTTLFPAGASQGTTVEITASGSFEHWPAGVWISGAGITVSPLKEKGKIRIVVSADAIPGTRWLRVFDSEGVSSLRPFIIGTVPELTEIEPNDEIRKTQVINKLPVVVNGRLGKRGDSDGFQVSLKKGETLVADLEANRQLGSPMDGVLQVANSKGVVLDQNDDNIGRDPRLTFLAPTDGTYLVRIFAFPTTPDSTIAFAGGDAFIYRLTLTTQGFLDYAFPFTEGRDCSCKVEAIGTSIPDAARLISLAEPESEGEPIPVWHKSLSGVSQSRRVSISAAEEAEPNDRAHAQALPFPVSLSGRIANPRDRDCYRVHLNKGNVVNVRLDSHAFGMPLDAVIKVTDPSGKAVLDLDDSGQERDPKSRFTASVEGDYLIEVSDLIDRGGVRFAYLLSIEPPTPDFAVSVVSDRIDAKLNETVNVTVNIDRKEGDARAIMITAEGLPDGITCKPLTSKAGTDSAKSVKLEFKLNDCVCPGSFRIVGKVEGGSQVHAAKASIAGFTTSTDQLWLSVIAAPTKPAEPAKTKK